MEQTLAGGAAGGIAAAEADGGKRRSAWKKFKADPVAQATAAFLLIVAASAAAAPWIAPYDPYEGNIAERLVGIGSAGHWLGTDEQGRDMLTRVLYGLRLTLLMGVVPVVAAGIVGTALGVVAGYYGKWANAVVMRTLDIFYAFPSLIIAIAIATALGPGLKNSFIAIPIVFIPSIARVVETSVQQIKGREYFEAAMASGAGDWMIIRHFLLPNIMRPVLGFVTTLFGASIIIATGLSFLGLGVSLPTPELGSMLRALQSSLYIQPWVAIVPGAVIFMLALAFNLLSDSLQDMFDSKI